jgi:iron-sulfur cluster assembly accessory protein
MAKSILSKINKLPISITDNAWEKMSHVLKNTSSAFLFSAKGGGCNGFNYNLNTIDVKEIESLSNEKILPTIIEKNNAKVMIEDSSLWLLIGTTIDYAKEDYSKGVFESRFIFTPKKEIASSCGCGISFTPKT